MNSPNLLSTWPAKWGRKNLLNRLNARIFTRQQLDQLEINAGLKTIRWGWNSFSVKWLIAKQTLALQM